LLVAVDATVAAFCALMAWTAADLSLRTNQYMVTIEVSKSVVYWVVCASFVAMTGYALWRLIRRLQGREKDAVHSLNID
jgi:TRAP-type C4-dicarboxylate transport system permease small subunit